MFISVKLSGVVVIFQGSERIKYGINLKDKIFLVFKINLPKYQSKIEIQK